MRNRSVGLIPCRLESKRLKNKLLKKICGYPLFAHTYFKSFNSNLNELYVCSGDEEIIEWCKKLNIKFIKTVNKHSNGTERCGEAGKILKLQSRDRIVNIQGDEPLVEKKNINLLLKTFDENKFSDLTTLHQVKKSKNDLNSTKLILNNKNKVLYISRADIPYSKKNLNKSIHIGIFCFEYRTLLKIVNYKKSLVEKSENIELIRCLENEINVFSYKITNNLIGVDTREAFNTVKMKLEEDTNYYESINKFYTLS